MHGYAWQRLAARMGREIVSGAFAAREQLPAGKLALYYGVNIRTLTKALAELVDQGLIVAEGQSYQQPGARNLHSHLSTVVLIGFGKRESGIAVGEPRTEAVIRSFEAECVTLGLTSRLVGFNHAVPLGWLDISTQLKEIKESAGYVVNAWNPWKRTHWQRWLDLFDFLEGTGKPVIILDQEGALVIPAANKRSTKLRVLRLSGARAGALVAQTLLRLGHRQIAFVSPASQSIWAHRRYDGLRDHVGKLGPTAAAVELFERGEVAD